MLPGPLPTAQLSRRSDPRSLPFATTQELEPLEGTFGQDRAAEAIRFGMAMKNSGYHVFVLGPTGVGKRALARRLLRERAATDPTPDDWCYLHSFDEPQRPRAMRLPAGRAAPFRRAMEGLVEELRAAIPASFESEEYRNRLGALHKELEAERERSLAEVQRKAEARGLAVIRTPVGFATAPVRDGQMLDPERFLHLPAEEQERIRREIAEVQEELAAVVRTFPAQERAHRERVRQMNRAVALLAVGHLIDELRKGWEALPQVLAHLDAVKTDVVENVHEFLGSAEGGADGGAAGQLKRMLAEAPNFLRYTVNVLVDRGGSAGAPIVEEDLPTHPALLGRIEHVSRFGALTTDFTLLRAGALHRANGGYLLIDARKLLLQPFSWEGLKRALRSHRVHIEPPERLFGLSGASSLEPEPIPLEVKVVLLGDRMLYYLLAEYDPEFLEIFKIASDFEDEVERDAAGELKLARLLAAIVHDERLRPFDRGAVARLVEHAARLSGDAERLTARVDWLADLARQSDHLAAGAGHELVGAADVQAALDGQERRSDRLRRLSQEQVARGTVLLDTAGAQIGQVNGLSVIQLGRFAFGRPCRITARVRLGKGEVVDIEREVELGGPLHSKGVLILGGFLGERYSAGRPLTLSASLVFEQSYGGVDGDSASSAELYALLSAISGVPLKQSLAVTGSVNQRGQVQAIGGVNEKIEGFFDLCHARGLTGGQGVLIPAGNVKHLMLRRDVLEAAGRGLFHVWPVETIDQGLALLTGLPAGERGADGRWPEGSVNARVEARLEALALSAREFGAPPREAAGAPGGGSGTPPPAT